MPLKMLESLNHYLEDKNNEEKKKEINLVLQSPEVAKIGAQKKVLTAIITALDKLGFDNEETKISGTLAKLSAKYKQVELAVISLETYKTTPDKEKAMTYIKGEDKQLADNLNKAINDFDLFLVSNDIEAIKKTYSEHQFDKELEAKEKAIVGTSAAELKSKHSIEITKTNLRTADEIYYLNLPKKTKDFLRNIFKRDNLLKDLEKIEYNIKYGLDRGHYEENQEEYKTALAKLKEVIAKSRKRKGKKDRQRLKAIISDAVSASLLKKSEFADGSDTLIDLRTKIAEIELLLKEMDNFPTRIKEKNIAAIKKYAEDLLVFLKQFKEVEFNLLTLRIPSEFSEAHKKLFEKFENDSANVIYPGILKIYPAFSATSSKAFQQIMLKAINVKKDDKKEESASTPKSPFHQKTTQGLVDGSGRGRTPKSPISLTSSSVTPMSPVSTTSSSEIKTTIPTSNSETKIAISPISTNSEASFDEENEEPNSPLPSLPEESRDRALSLSDVTEEKSRGRALSDVTEKEFLLDSGEYVDNELLGRPQSASIPPPPPSQPYPEGYNSDEDSETEETQSNLRVQPPARHTRRKAVFGGNRLFDLTETSESVSKNQTKIQNKK